MPNAFMIRAVVGLSWLAAATGSQMCYGQPQISLQASAPEVRRYEHLEFLIPLDRQCGELANGFDPATIDLSIQLKTPKGGRLRLPAFYCQKYERRADVPGPRGTAWMYPAGQPVWLARVAPTEIGRYEAVAQLKTPDGTGESAAVGFTCVPSDRQGFLRVSPQDPRFFAFDSGVPFFPIGQNLAFIGESQYVSLGKIDEIFRKLSDNGANYLRIWTCCQDWALAIESPKSTWGRSWGGRPSIVPLSEAEAAAAGSDRGTAPGSRKSEPPAAAAPVNRKPTERKCIKIVGGEKGTLAVTPCHAVALRPNTKYTLSGRSLTTAGARLRVTSGRHALDVPVASGPTGDWVEFRLSFTTAADEFWLGQTAVGVEGSGTAWLADLALREASGGPELLWEADVNRPARGFYNPVDCWMLDEVVAAAEKHGIYLQLCIITRDLYMEALKDEQSAEYEQAIQDAQKLLRYAVARWGYSTSVATWEYFNENNPGLPSDRFYTALGEYLEQTDVYRHLRQTSEWGPSPRDCRHPKLDVADVHFYLRSIKDPPFQDEVQAAVGQAKFLREHAPRKPALIAEFGLANEKWQPTLEMGTSELLIDFHNGLWASALSGTSGTAMFWWWDRLDQRNAYPLYRPLATFLAGIPWTTANLQATSAAVTEPRLRLVGLQGRDRGYFWLFDPQASWNNVVIRKQTPPEVTGAELTVRELGAGSYRVQWWDTWLGQSVREETCLAGRRHAPAGGPGLYSRPGLQD